MHESLDEFDIWPDWTTDYTMELAALERMKKIP